MAVLFLLLVMLINAAVNFAVPSIPQCWEFNTETFNGWTDDGFTSSLSAPPETYGIPDWTPPADYAYVQTASTSETGGLTTPFTINDGDVIAARLYKHLVQFDDTDRIIILFSTNGLATTLLTNPNYDQWDVEQVTCGVGYFNCCTAYPCDGLLQVEGTVLTTLELVGVDYVEINSGCGVAPPTPPYVGYNCDFDSSVCGWSLAVISDGWHWSVYDAGPDPVRHPSFPVPNSPYIWVEDTSAKVSSELINGVSGLTVFSLDYYFETSGEGVNSFEILFVETEGGPRAPFDTIYSGSGAWTRIVFSSPDVCLDPLLPCSGVIVISTTNTPFSGLLLAIDNFVVDL